ncbi:phage tail protein [Citrobacter freundii]|uniref:gp53-like domain-containing protein n=3 Tax=Citrobacter freundii TaxID=546 RepID=UPI003A977EE0
MANLPETPQWEEGIYQIEVSDPVLGGPDGISNRQGKQLASRTLYLKQQVEKGGTDLAKHIAAADPHTQYAPKASPTFTGTPTAPTPANSDNSKKLATTEFVAKALAALAGSAPETLDTLKELADALGNDPNFATTVLNKLAEKLAKDQNGADIPDPALFVKNLGLKEAAKRDVGTGTNQIPDMGAFASGTGWFKLPSGYIVQFGTYSGNTTRFISGNFPIPFPTQPLISISVMSDAVQSNPSGPFTPVLSVNFEHISNSSWRVSTSDNSQQYRFSYISIGR